MTWDPELAKEAQAYANKQARIDNYHGTQHDKQYEYGENTCKSKGYMSMAEASKFWIE